MGFAQGAGVGWRAVAPWAAVALLGLVATVWGGPALGLWQLLMLAPLVEEAIFRAGLQEAMLRHGRSPALSNGVTACAFALAHVVVRADAAAALVMLPALLIGIVYGARRRLRECVALHAAMNALWLLWTLAGSPGPWH
jgi:membrane protease YdiL (CAAX protease family)